MSPRGVVLTHLWVRWAILAIREEAAAKSARVQLLEIGPAGGEQFDIALESDAAMLAVAGSAHSIDGLYGEVKELIPIARAITATWERNKTPRHARIFETLKAGFRLGQRGGTWARELDWLFDARDFAVHHGPEFHEPVNHPLGVRTSRDAMYTAEAATRAVDLLVGLLERMIEAPSPRRPDVQKWTTDLRRSVEVVVALRCEHGG